jgi:hypothetical protein
MVFSLMMATLMQEGKGGHRRKAVTGKIVSSNMKTDIGFNLHAPLAVAGWIPGGSRQDSRLRPLLISHGMRTSLIGCETKNNKDIHTK